MTILHLQRRLHEAGRIRIGATTPTAKGGKRPIKLETFRFTSRREQSIRDVAESYGGQVQPWEDAPGGPQWQVFTEASEIPVVVPPEQMSFSQYMELWSGGGCLRRCDGESQNPGGEPCVCDPENPECKPHTRLSLMLAQYPGTGLWRLDTGGWNAATELSGAMELLALLTRTVGRSVIPGTLRLEARTVKRPDEPTKNFAVPVLDFAVDMAALAVGTAAQIEGRQPELAEVHRLTPVPFDETPAPPLLAQLEAVNAPEPKAPRSNSAPEIPPTGMKPRAAESAEDAEALAKARSDLMDAIKQIDPPSDRNVAMGFLEEKFGSLSSRTIAQLEEGTELVSKWPIAETEPAPEALV